LQVTAAGVGKGAHHLAIGLAKVAIKILHRRIDRFRHRIAAITKMQRRRRRNGHFRRARRVRSQELEMLDHRMRLKAAELADHAQQDRPRLRPARLKLYFALAGIGFDIVEPFEEIDIP
jgi:predicted phage tail protein